MIPAFNEADRLPATLAGVRAALAGLAALAGEILVVDDGSADGTPAVAAGSEGVTLLRMERNRGKGAALTRGLSAAGGEVLVMLDADLGETAWECARLIEPVLRGEADMTIATFPAGAAGGGFGTVARVARWGVRRLTGRRLEAPLSGQRAFTRTVWDQVGAIAAGYGAEVGLDVDVLRAGFRVVEVPTGMRHRLTGRDLAGFRHRGRQLLAVTATLLRKWRRR